MRRTAVLADDLTGATDVGAACLGDGVASRIAALPSAAAEVLLDETPLAAVNTQSRQLDAAAARACVARIAALAGERRIVKKTDSALRGPLGAELDALLAATGERRLVFVPAYPEAGRTTSGGIHRIHGVPVAMSDFGRDPLTPVTESRVVDLLHQSCDRSVQLCAPAELPDLLSRPAAAEILVVEASTAAEVHDAARLAVMHDALAAGPAGFVRHLIALRPGDLRPASPAPLAAPLLAVWGSLHPVARAQARKALAAGFVSFTPDGSPDEIAAALSPGAAVLVDTAASEPPARELTARLGELVREVVASRAGRPVRLALAGGETAYGVLAALHWSVLLPFAAPEPGVCWSQLADREDQVLTKSGAFGSEALLAGLA